MMNSSSSVTKPVPEFFSHQVSGARRFYLDLNPLSDQPLKVVCGGYEHCQPDYAIHRDTFPYFSIEFVFRGRGKLILKGRSHELQPGSVFSYNHGVPHAIATDPDALLGKYFVDFTGTEAEALLRSCNLWEGRFLQVFQISEVQSIFDELIRSGRKATPFTQPLCAALLKCLALRMAESRTPLEKGGKLSFSTFQRCQEYMHEHFLEVKTVAEVARKCHIHEVYLCRLFRRYNHQGPHRYLTLLKMNRAAELLEVSGAMVKQVAEEVGFEDPFHFSRAFKNIFGLSPDAFRRLH